MVTVPIKEQTDIKAMKEFFLKNHAYRDYTLFVMGINTALRISDLLNLRWDSVFDFEHACFRRHIYIIEAKTNKHTCIAINDSCILALGLLREDMKPCKSDYIFYSGKRQDFHISRNRAYHIIKDAARMLNLEGNISCHSLRKTFGYHAWKRGTPPALIMHVYNHSNIEITKRYLGIDQDDKDALFQQINL